MLSCKDSLMSIGCKEEESNTMIDHLLSLQNSQPEYYTNQIIKGLILVSAVNTPSLLFKN